MIDLNDKFKKLCDDFKVTEKEAVLWIRSYVRAMWSKSPAKLNYLNERIYLVRNTNPRSMKRYPQVKKIKCEICGGEFGLGEIEVDHRHGNNSMKTFNDVESFYNSILFVQPQDLQVLCKDKKNSKKQVIRFGCHSIKTHADKHSISFEEAKIMKEIIKADKEDGCVGELMKLGVFSIPTTKFSRRKLLENILLNKREGELN